jgi:hypothetical protein
MITFVFERLQKRKCKEEQKKNAARSRKNNTIKT